MSGSFTDPFNLDGAQARLKLQEQVLQALQQQAQGEIQPVGSNGGVARVSPWQALAKVFSAYSAKKQSDAVTEQKEKIAQSMQQLLGKGFQDYQNTLAPKAVEAAGPPTEEGIPAMKIQPGDPQAAVLGALSSQHPVLRQFGGEQLKHLNDLTKQAQGKEADYQAMIAKAMLENQLKQQIGVKDLLGYANPNAIPAMLQQGTGAFQPKPQLSFQGERWWETGTGKPQDVGGISFGKPVTVGGDLYQGNNATGQVRKLDNAPRVNVNASTVNAGQKAGYEETFKQNAKLVKELGDIARTSSNMVQSLAEMEQLDKNGIYSNVTSGPATWLANLSQALGLPMDANKLKNTEAYKSATTDLWVNRISSLQGGMHGVTKEEALKIEKILPMTEHSPEARREITAIIRKGAQRNIDRFKNANAAHNTSLRSQDPAQFSELFQDVNLPAPVEPDPAVKPTGLQPSNTRKGIRIIGVTQ